MLIIPSIVDTLPKVSTSSVLKSKSASLRSPIQTTRRTLFDSRGLISNTLQVERPITYVDYSVASVCELHGLLLTSRRVCVRAYDTGTRCYAGDFLWWILLRTGVLDGVGAGDCIFSGSSNMI